MRALAALLIMLAWPAAAAAQNVGAVATGTTCDSSPVAGLADQLVTQQLCTTPGSFVDVAPHANVVLSSTRVHAVMNAMARDAVWSAAGSVEIDVNSMFRTLAEQYVLYHRSGCFTPAMPGTSPHESGRALDVGNYAAAGVTSALVAAGCAHSNPTGDPVHFDCPGPNLAADNIRTFQHLWNLNNPGDTIAEDGSYGPMTESRLVMSPAAGFAIAGDCPTTMPDAGVAPDMGSAPPDAGSAAPDSGSAADMSATEDLGAGADLGGRPYRMSTGCGCSTSSAHGAGPGALVSLLALALRRRRPRVRLGRA